jgi:hypothetical protein
MGLLLKTPHRIEGRRNSFQKPFSENFGGKAASFSEDWRLLA